VQDHRIERDVDRVVGPSFLEFNKALVLIRQ
jgi:hypothetical protein